MDFTKKTEGQTRTSITLTVTSTRLAALMSPKYLPSLIDSTGADAGFFNGPSRHDYTKLWDQVHALNDEDEGGSEISEDYSLIADDARPWPMMDLFASISIDNNRLACHLIISHLSNAACAKASFWLNDLYLNDREPLDPDLELGVGWFEQATSVLGFASQSELLLLLEELGTGIPSRGALVPLFQKMDQLLESCAFSTIDRILSEAVVGRLSVTSMLFLLRSTAKFKTVLPSWEAFLAASVAESSNRACNIEAAFKGLL